MKEIILFFVTIVIILNSCDSSNEPQLVDLSGVWDGEILNVEDEPVYLDIDFTEENGIISGYGRIHRTSLKTIEGDLSGSWDGNKIEFSLTNVEDSIKINFTGTGGSQTISGSYSILGNLTKENTKLLKTNDGGFNINNRSVTTSKVAGIYTYNWSMSDISGSASGSFRIAMISDGNKIYANVISGTSPFYNHLDYDKYSPSSAVVIPGEQASGSIIGKLVSLTFHRDLAVSSFNGNGSFSLVSLTSDEGFLFHGTYSVTGPE